MKKYTKKIKFASAILMSLVLISPYQAIAADTLLDSYSEANMDNNFNIEVANIQTAGETFTTPNDGNSYNITLAKFYMAITAGAPATSAYAKLWAMTGTCGTNATPTGAALATSDAFNTSSLTGSYVLRDITFSSGYTMSPNTCYGISFTFNTDTTGNDVGLAFDGSSPTAAGNVFYTTNNESSWLSQSTSDIIFYVYGNLPSTTDNGLQLTLAMTF